MPAVQSLTVEINGRVSASVLKMIADMEKKLRDLNASSKTSAAVMNRMYNQAFGRANEVAKATDKIGESMKRVGEIAGGVTLGEMFKSGLEEAAQLIERLADGMKEFAVASLEVRATREVMQNQQRAMLESQGKAAMGPGIDTMIRNAEGRETLIRYDQLMDTTNLLMSSAPQRFKSVEDIHKMLGELSDVSKNPATFDLASHAITRILAEGKVDQQHLQEMSVDTGYAFKKAMADALRVTPEQLTEMIKKHTITGEASIDALLKGFDLITGKGGAAYRHAEAQLRGLEGIWARFQGHWADFEESFGKQLENFLSPLAEKLFDLLTPAELTHAFDFLDESTQHLGALASYAIEIGEATMGRFQPFLDKFRSEFDGFNTWIASMFTSVDIPNQGRVEVLSPSGFDVLSQMIDKVENLFARISALVTSKGVQDFASWSSDMFTDGLKRFFDWLEEIFALGEDIKSGDWTKFASDWKKYEWDPREAELQHQKKVEAAAERLKHWMPPDISPQVHGYEKYGPQNAGEGISALLAPNTDALQQSTDASEKLRQAIEDATGGWLPSGGSSGVSGQGRNAGLHGGLSDALGAVYEQYPWEGHAANYGAYRNMKLQDDDTEVGIGEALAREKGIKLGDYAKIKFADGTEMIRQRQETSERPHGIEFFSDKAGKYSKHGSATVEKVDKPTSDIHIHYNPVVSAFSSEGIRQVLDNHVDAIADAIHRHTASWHERSAVI